ncbi:DUF2283 domain-containing protein [Amycolatopsis sp. NPDC059021]|uniref:DUF2283 domain-containing protein n=1 Tax=Amycolatopsis sp. NPDC059021 TaxID=3346704 RepID=UPI0036722354
MTRDQEVNAAYLRFPGEPSGVTQSVPVEYPPGETALVIDFASDGRVIGIEFLNAATQLPEE